MKNLETINKKFTIYEQTYRISRFTADTDAEKKFGDNPWIAVHDSYTEADLPLNGLQMLISKDYDGLMTRVKIDAAGRKFRAENPNATEMEYLMHIAKLEV